MMSKKSAQGREQCPRLPHLREQQNHPQGVLTSRSIFGPTSFTSVKESAAQNTLGQKHTHQNQSTCGLHLGLLSYLPKRCPCVQSSPPGAAPSRPPRWCSPNTPGPLLEKASQEAVSSLTWRSIALQC